jgi:hypothetical protein
VKVFSNGLIPATRDDGPPCPAQVGLCRRWLALYVQPRKTINPRRSSYGLKHTVEDWAGDYITNGAFIAAAIAEGYRIDQIGGGPNAHFNMSFVRVPK